MNKLLLKDLKWFLVKENPIINFLHYLVYRIHGIPEKENEITDQNRKILTKTELKNTTEFFIPKNPFFVIGYTSGTTISPLKVYRSYFNVIYEEYTIKSYLFKIGISTNPKIAIIRGDNLFTNDIKEPPYWKHMSFTKRLLMSSFHLSNKNIPHYLKALDEFKPELIMAYPSSIIAISKVAIQQGWYPKWNLKAVVTSSETFAKENQDVVRKVFPHLFDHYGQAERVAAFQQCEYGMYHVREDYSIVEFHEDQYGIKIIGTSKRNKLMPLYRYDTGDYIEGLGKEICKCGSKSRYVSRILGRDDDSIILHDGRIFGRLSVVFRNIPNLIECQIEQDLIDHITIRFVPKSSEYIEDVSNEIKKELLEKIGNEIKMDLYAVKLIERTKAGKFKAVINSINKI